MMKTEKQRYFPAELLSASVDTRLEYFLNKIIDHPHLGDAKDEFMKSVVCKSAADIVVLTGPTGVGKQTLGRKVEKLIRDRHEQEMKDDLNFLPVVSLSSVATSKPGFSWKDFYIRLLRRLDETQLGQRTLFSLEPYRALDVPRGRAANSCPDEALQRAVESMIRARRTKIIMIYDAHQILLSAQDSRVREQFEVIMSLSKATSATIVLIGSYELLAIQEQRAGVVCRSQVVHLPQYAWNNQVDRESFRRALLSFQRQMPFPVEPNLVDHVDMFYLKSAGCIGTLKEWLDRAVENALKKGLETIDYGFIDSFAPANKDIRRVFDEAVYGEGKLADITDDQLLSYVQSQTRYQKPLSPKPKRSGVIQQAAKAGKKKRRPGQRNPVRDPVGGSGDLFGYGNAA